MPSTELSGAPVYALGALSFDFESIEQRDAMYASNGGRPIITNADLGDFLSRTTEYDAFIWTLVIDRAPIYALRTPNSRPLDTWALYQRLLEVLLDPLVDRIAVPGRLGGEVKLLDGRVVRVIETVPRSLRKWSTTAIGRSVGLAGEMALPAGLVNLSQGTPAPSDWSSWNVTPPVHKRTGGQLAVAPIGPGGATLLTPYTGGTIPITWLDADGTSPPPPGGAFAGTAASAAAGGLQLTVYADDTPRTLRLYARSFASSATISAALSDGSAAAYLDTSFDAFPSVAGLPGAVDGVYTITYRLQSRDPGTILVQLAGAPAPAATPNPLSVTLFSHANGTGDQLQVPVGLYPQSEIPAILNGIGSAFVPAGLRLTVYNEDIFNGHTPTVGAALPATATGATSSPLPPGVVQATKSLIVEPENYVGLQAASLTSGPSSPAPLVGLGRLFDFMDRVYGVLRNRGMSPGERAINFAATEAMVEPGTTTPSAMNLVLTNALAAGLDLEAISAEPTLATRPGADCWDVRFTFIDPRQVIQAPHLNVRITVDVASDRPLAITPARTWTAY